MKSDLPQAHLDTDQGNKTDIIKNHSLCKTRGRGPSPGRYKIGQMGPGWTGKLSSARHSLWLNPPLLRPADSLLFFMTLDKRLLTSLCLTHASASFVHLYNLWDCCELQQQVGSLGVWRDACWRSWDANIPSQRLPPNWEVPRVDNTLLQRWRGSPDKQTCGGCWSETKDGDSGKEWVAYPNKMGLLVNVYGTLSMY